MSISDILFKYSFNFALPLISVVRVLYGIFQSFENEDQNVSCKMSVLIRVPSKSITRIISDSFML